MKKFTHFKNFLRHAGIFFLIIVLSNCSDDEESLMPTGIIHVEETNQLTGIILNIPQVTVGQNSWLAAVEIGEETTNNFIAPPVMIEKGTVNNVELLFEETAIDFIAGYQQVVLKLYADNQNSGVIGQWDQLDKPVTYSNNILILKRITIMADLSNFDAFNYYDTNKNGFLDLEEVSRTYSSEQVFRSKNNLSLEAFYPVMYHSTDLDYYDGGITKTEWNQGYSRMFRKWTIDNFSGFDLDKNEFINIDEWNTIFNESGWFESYDKNSDGLVSREELQTGFFGDWDYNVDGKIDREEFDNYRGYTGNLSDGARPI